MNMKEIIKEMKDVDLYKSTSFEKFRLLKAMRRYAAYGWDWDWDDESTQESQNLMNQAMNCLEDLLEFELEQAAEDDEFVLGTSPNMGWFQGYEEALHNLEELVVKLDLA